MSLFNIIDTNGDKKVDNTEISVFMQALQEYDKNNDNNIDKKEFKNFISTLKKNIKLDFKFDIEAVKNASSEDIITFEEVFYLEYGVEYSKQNMEKLLKNKSNYILEKQKFERKTQIHAILDDALALNKGNAAGGTSAELEQSSKQLESAIISVLKTLGANTDEEMTKLLPR